MSCFGRFGNTWVAVGGMVIIGTNDQDSIGILSLEGFRHRLQIAGTKGTGYGMAGDLVQGRTSGKTFGNQDPAVWSAHSVIAAGYGGMIRPVPEPKSLAVSATP